MFARPRGDWCSGAGVVDTQTCSLRFNLELVSGLITEGLCKDILKDGLEARSAARTGAAHVSITCLCV